jgi:hypothetical protein
VAPSVQRLDWDSEFFGINIGQVALDGCDADDLRSIDNAARELELDCLYASVSDPGKDHVSLLAQRQGFRLVEINQLMERPAGPFDRRPTESVARKATLDDLAHLDDAIDVLANWSRFAVDPRFGVIEARRMHGAWVERAIRDDGDTRLAVLTETDAGITGISTNVRGPEIMTRVDFMGVTVPGTGASWALLDELLAWAGPEPVEGGPCAARNVAPLRFLEHCGFHLKATTYSFHRWLDEQ